MCYSELLREDSVVHVQEPHPLEHRCTGCCQTSSPHQCTVVWTHTTIGLRSRHGVGRGSDCARLHAPLPPFSAATADSAFRANSRISEFHISRTPRLGAAAAEAAAARRGRCTTETVARAGLAAVDRAPVAVHPTPCHARVNRPCAHRRRPTTDLRVAVEAIERLALRETEWETRPGWGKWEGRWR